MRLGSVVLLVDVISTVDAVVVTVAIANVAAICTHWCHFGDCYWLCCGLSVVAAVVAVVAAAEFVGSLKARWGWFLSSC